MVMMTADPQASIFRVLCKYCNRTTLIKLLCDFESFVGSVTVKGMLFRNHRVRCLQGKME